MGIIQNWKLWENNVTFIDEDGVTITRTIPRVMPPALWKVMALLSFRSWLYFAMGLAAWTADGYDFNAVNLVATELSARCGRSLSPITVSVTLTLLIRSLGAFLIGMLADISGQKWPLFLNLVVLSALQIATAFAPTYSAFIGVRALFGIFIGGIWVLSAALTLENMPAEARGLFSGLLQQSYALGYLIAAGVNLGAVPSTKMVYQTIFFVGAGFTALIAIFALLIPESHIYRDNKHITNTKSRYAGVWKDPKFTSHLH